jgi:hypothetical protein
MCLIRIQIGIKMLGERASSISWQARPRERSVVVGLIKFVGIQMTFRSLFNHGGFGMLGMVFMILSLSIAGVTVMTLINPSTLTRQSRETVLKAVTLRSAIQSYRFSHGGSTGTYPPDLIALVVDDGVPCTLDSNPTHSTYQILQGWCGPYVDQVFLQNLLDYKTDGFGTLFQFAAGSGIITSCGTDKICGGADDLVFNP